ncbi:hypothetical protein [Spirulina sp. 06S082]|uniref:TRAFAC clade GTPase domain-containing protein n=1 Tax=Spirulina sp. 06S082 TaxID=3110248 RepID=UPI002B2129EC|nr:hypothetical protein [Spirulina sp. 06S082]MEA5470369.1 hypothetical protein [Spirulina sp. 06S082]
MGNICVIGPRASGKTTYLAALAYKRMTIGKSKQFNIIPLNDDSREIAEKAENIICQGESFEPTRVESVDTLPDYSFKIAVKKFPRIKEESFQLVFKDYPGEVFEKIAESDAGDAIQEEFIEECFRKDVEGCLILFSDWIKGTDNHYNRIINRFLELMDSHDRAKDLRLAVAMSKCERGELWSGRLDPETDLFNRHLPMTTATLREKVTPKNIRFYAISTFGVLRRNDPRPNRIDEQGKSGQASVLREVPRWQPYNIIAPLYWLNKG